MYDKIKYKHYKNLYKYYGGAIVSIPNFNDPIKINEDDVKKLIIYEKKDLDIDALLEKSIEEIHNAVLKLPDESTLSGNTHLIVVYKKELPVAQLQSTDILFVGKYSGRINSATYQDINSYNELYGILTVDESRYYRGDFISGYAQHNLRSTIGISDPDTNFAKLYTKTETLQVGNYEKGCLIYGKLFRNNQVYYIGTVKNNKPNGRGLTYYSNSEPSNQQQIASVGDYSDGLLKDGIRYFYYMESHPKLKWELEYKDFKFTGNGSYISLDGKKLANQSIVVTKDIEKIDSSDRFSNILLMTESDLKIQSLRRSIEQLIIYIKLLKQNITKAICLKLIDELKNALAILENLLDYFGITRPIELQILINYLKFLYFESKNILQINGKIVEIELSAIPNIPSSVRSIINLEQKKQSYFDEIFKSLNKLLSNCKNPSLEKDNRINYHCSLAVEKALTILLDYQNLSESDKSIFKKRINELITGLKKLTLTLTLEEINQLQNTFESLDTYYGLLFILLSDYKLLSTKIKQDKLNELSIQLSMLKNYIANLNDPNKLDKEKTIQQIITLFDAIIINYNLLTDIPEEIKIQFQSLQDSIVGNKALKILGIGITDNSPVSPKLPVSPQSPVSPKSPVSSIKSAFTNATNTVRGFFSRN